jgi:hypothetical protein
LLADSKNVHILLFEVQGTTVCTAVANLGLKLFALGQAYVALIRVRLLNGLRLIKLDCEKLTNEKISKTDALMEMERLRTLAKLNENFKFGNF